MEFDSGFADMVFDSGFTDMVFDSGFAVDFYSLSIVPSSFMSVSCLRFERVYLLLCILTFLVGDFWAVFLLVILAYRDVEKVFFPYFSCF